MPRKPRMYLPGVPCHVIQRGNNREATFFSEQDYLFYLDCLTDASRKYHVNIHAYILMTNHVHLLMTPAHKEAISLTMQSIGRRYVQYINREYNRTGTLWESRHKASLVDSERYLLTCSRYIELNPVNANMVKHPAQYKWSSYMFNAHGETSSLIKPHDVYRQLGKKHHEQQEAYAALFNDHIEPADINLINNAIQFSVPTGDHHFKEQIERILKRKTGFARLGRPFKNSCK